MSKDAFSPIGRDNFSRRCSCSRLAVGLQVASDCRRLAGSVVAKRGRICYGGLSFAYERSSDEKEELGLRCGRAISEFHIRHQDRLVRRLSAVFRRNAGGICRKLAKYRKSMALLTDFHPCESAQF